MDTDALNNKLECVDSNFYSSPFPKKHENEKKDTGNENVNEKQGVKAKKTFAERQIENQFYSITYEEKRRANSMKTRRGRVDELKLMEGSGIKKTIEDEISATLKRKSWKSLDLCFKWNAINEYISRLKDQDPDFQVTDEDIKTIRGTILNKTSNVKYNKENQQVECLYFKTRNGVEI